MCGRAARASLSPVMVDNVSSRGPRPPAGKPHEQPRPSIDERHPKAPGPPTPRVLGLHGRDDLGHPLAFAPIRAALVHRRRHPAARAPRPRADAEPIGEDRCEMCARSGHRLATRRRVWVERACGASDVAGGIREGGGPADGPGLKARRVGE